MARNETRHGHRGNQPEEREGRKGESSGEGDPSERGFSGPGHPSIIGAVSATHEHRRSFGLMYAIERDRRHAPILPSNNLTNVSGKPIRPRMFSSPM